MTVERAHEPGCTAFDVVTCVMPGCSCWCHAQVQLSPSQQVPDLMAALQDSVDRARRLRQARVSGQQVTVLADQILSDSERKEATA